MFHDRSTKRSERSVAQRMKPAHVPPPPQPLWVWVVFGNNYSWAVWGCWTACSGFPNSSSSSSFVKPSAPTTRVSIIIRAAIFDIFISAELDLAPASSILIADIAKLSLLSRAATEPEPVGYSTGTSSTWYDFVVPFQGKKKSDELNSR